MCGRARCTLRHDDIPRACHLNDGPVRTIQMDRYHPSYNVSPGSYLPVVRREDGSPNQGVIHCMKWGLIPSFTKKTEKLDHYRMFNARSESIYEKASFRRLIPNSRCFVVVEGFYEWKKDGSKKQPYYIHLKDGRPLVFAALYDSWKNSEGEVLYTFTIVTTSSSSRLQWLHDRMPVILGNKIATDAWLFGTPSTKYDMYLKPYENSDLVWYPVTPAMGKPGFNGPECIKEIQLKTQEQNSIIKFFSPKGVNSDKDGNPKMKTDLPESVKEESETEDKTGDYDSKSNVLLPDEGGAKCQLKREYEETSADSKSSNDEVDKVSSTPVRKKGKSEGDKQPTLFSYFGKS